MGLDISVESRSGDTSSDKKARQRSRPPNILLTTPESLSLLLSYPDSFAMFADLKTVVIDEIHAFAPGKRGDLLSLALSRLQHIAPGLRRVGLSASSEEHTSELQSLMRISYAVFCLKKTNSKSYSTTYTTRHTHI